MYSVDVLESIQDPKLRSFLQNHYFKIHVKLGYLFDVFIKDISTAVRLYNMDDVVYDEIIVDYALVPRPEVVFISTYAAVNSLNLPLNSKVVRVPPTPRSPYNITKYSLHKLMCPTMHALNLDTTIGGTVVSSKVKLYSGDVTETVCGGVIGVPVPFERN